MTSFGKDTTSMPVQQDFTTYFESLSLTEHEIYELYAELRREKDEKNLLEKLRQK